MVPHSPTPLQMGVPGGLEIAIILLIAFIPLAAAYWVATDARRHGSDHPLAWGAMAFVAGFAYGLGLVVFVVFYLVVRDDLGPAGARATD